MIKCLEESIKYILLAKCRLWSELVINLPTTRLYFHNNIHKLKWRVTGCPRKHYTYWFLYSSRLNDLIKFNKHQTIAARIQHLFKIQNFLSVLKNKNYVKSPKIVFQVSCFWDSLFHMKISSFSLRKSTTIKSERSVYYIISMGIVCMVCGSS